MNNNNAVITMEKNIYTYILYLTESQVFELVANLNFLLCFILLMLPSVFVKLLCVTDFVVVTKKKCFFFIREITKFFVLSCLSQMRMCVCVDENNCIV